MKGDEIRPVGYYWVKVKGDPDEWVVAYWHFNENQKYIFGFICPDTREIIEVDEKQITHA